MLLNCLYVLYFELYDFWILPLRPLRIFWSVFWCVSCIFWRVDFSFVNVAWQIVILYGMLIDWPAAKKKFYRKQNVSGRYWTVEGRYCWLSCHKLMQCMSLWRECECSRFRSRSDSGKIREECTTIFFNSPKTRNFKSNSSGQRSPTSQNKIQRTDQERREEMHDRSLEDFEQHIADETHTGDRVWTRSSNAVYILGNSSPEIWIIQFIRLVEYVMAR